MGLIDVEGAGVVRIIDYCMGVLAAALDVAFSEDPMLPLQQDNH